MVPSTDFMVLSSPWKEFGNILGDFIAAFQYLRTTYKKRNMGTDFSAGPVEIGQEVMV